MVHMLLSTHESWDDFARYEAHGLIGYALLCNYKMQSEGRHWLTNTRDKLVDKRLVKRFVRKHPGAATHIFALVGVRAGSVSSRSLVTAGARLRPVKSSQLQRREKGPGMTRIPVI